MCFCRNVNLLVKKHVILNNDTYSHKSILLKFGTDINEPILYSKNLKTLE